MEWLLWAYPLIGAASIYPLARYQRLDNPDDTAGYSAFMGFTYSLVWPVMALVAATGYALKREERRAKALTAEKMTLETAYDVIAKHEAKQHEERRQRNERLRRDWTRLSGLEVGLNKPAMPWESERNPLWEASARWRRSSINTIWDHVQAAEEEDRRHNRS